MDCSTPGFPVHHQLHQSLFKLMSIESLMPPNHLTLCHPLLLLPSVFLSIRVFSSESALHINWPEYWSFSFSISPSNDIHGWFPSGLTGLISLLSKGLSSIFSNTTVQELWELYHVRTWAVLNPAESSCSQPRLEPEDSAVKVPGESWACAAGALGTACLSWTSFHNCWSFPPAFVSPCIYVCLSLTFLFSFGSFAPYDAICFWVSFFSSCL